MTTDIMGFWNGSQLGIGTTQAPPSGIGFEVGASAKFDYPVTFAATIPAFTVTHLNVAVARHESGINQYRPDGSLVTGAAGEIGIFQVMPSTAPGMDLANPRQNITAGVGYLALPDFSDAPLSQGLREPTLVAGGSGADCRNFFRPRSYLYGNNEALPL